VKRLATSEHVSHLRYVLRLNAQRREIDGKERFGQLLRASLVNDTLGANLIQAKTL
jgi:hypothetical protein